MQIDKTAKPFGIADKLGYMFGDFGNDFTFILSSSMLMKFYTDVMGVSAGVVGLMMMLARIVDAFTDVGMGQIVDRTPPAKDGKFKPWIRRMMGPVAVASVLLYASWFQNMPMTFKIVWMFCTYLLWGSVCYTGINIPYGSMASAISPEPKDRTSLSTFRSIGGTLASMVIGVVLPLVVYYTDSEGNRALSGPRMSIAAVGCSIGAVICYLLCYNLTTERVKFDTNTAKTKNADGQPKESLFKILISSRALIGIILAALCLLISSLSLQGMYNYIFPNYFGNSNVISLVTLLASVIALGCSTFVGKLANRFGKKELCTCGTAIAAISCLVLYFMHTSNLVLFIVLLMIANAGFGVFNLMCWAMITDVIDDIEVKSKKRNDGTVYAVYSFARKLGQAASSGLTGGLLSMVGYSQATAFKPSVTNGIYNITTIIPAVTFVVLTLVLAFVYPLSKKRVEANSAVLKERRGE